MVDQVARAAAAVRGRTAGRADGGADGVQGEVQVGIVLGSGLGGLAAGVAEGTSIPYAEIPGLPATAVAGHAGRLLLGEVEGVRCALLAGRAHFYEGHTMAEVTFGVRLLRALGAQTLVLTNAAGGLNPDYQVGDAMVIADHIFLPGLAGFHPLRGPNDDALGPRFPPMAGAYDPALRQAALEEARTAGLRCHSGLYVMVSGPSYETGAEVRFLRAAGADAVGMSTCPEVVVARHARMRVLGISLITNVVAPDRPEAAGHAQVQATAERGAPAVERIVRGVIRRLGEQQVTGAT